jgi:hypothetical protein
MKRNAEKLPVEVCDQESESSAVGLRHQGNGGIASVIPSGGQAPRPRPEIAVLGWNIRSYRLSLRQSKA